MTCKIRVIGLGQRAAGDDGVGIAVLEVLRGRQQSADTQASGHVELVEADPTALIDLLDGVTRAILVDAVVTDGPPGRLLRLRAEELEAARLRPPTSSHGFDVRRAVELARVLHPASVCRDIWVVAITISLPSVVEYGLSGSVAEAVPAAVQEIENLLDVASRA